MIRKKTRETWNVPVNAGWTLFIKKITTSILLVSEAYKCEGESVCWVKLQIRDLPQMLY